MNKLNCVISQISQIKKKLLIITLVALPGCSFYDLPILQINKSKELCEPHGGLLYMRIDSTNSQGKKVEFIRCKDSSYFKGIK